MTLEQLRIFIAVAEYEHMTRAAADLNLTQSATSAAVAALEARYDIKLFNRIGRRIELTPAGRLFLVEARAVLARAAAAENVLADIAGLKRGSLRLAASQTVGNYWLPPLMHRYRASYPGITLALSIGNTETVAAMVREGIADLALAGAQRLDLRAMQHDTRLEGLEDLIIPPGFMIGHDVGHKTIYPQMPWSPRIKIPVKPEIKKPAQQGGLENLTAQQSSA